MKRQRAAHAGGGPHKKARLAVKPASQSATATPAATDHPVLRRLYPHVLTLRHHLLSRLPSSSKGRRRRIAQLGLTTPSDSSDLELGQLLDSTLVGSAQDAKLAVDEATNERRRDIETFTQQRPQGISGGTFNPGYLLQSEIVDFIVWLLFKRSSAHKPPHLLCHGFQRAEKTIDPHAPNLDQSSSIPGLTVRSHNGNVRTLKGPIWCRLQSLLGQGGDHVMINLLLDCAVFCPIPGDLGNYYQLSGLPVSNLKPDQKVNGLPKQNDDIKAGGEKPCIASDKSPSTITFVRSRMLYAKAALNAKCGVRFGMRHIHVLNRFSDRSDQQQTLHILKYIFPRQFGLHNVFTSKTDARETAMPFKDYTLREKEIHQKMCKDLGHKSTDADEVCRWKARVPKRLRGAAVALCNRLRNLNHRCSYVELLRYYCPVEKSHLLIKPRRVRQTGKSKIFDTQKELESVHNLTAKFETANVIDDDDQHSEQTCFMDMACPTAHVSAFCRAVIARVVPRDFWGGDVNERNMMYWVDQFVSIRRFESVTLHQIMHNLRVADIDWLRPPGTANTTKMAKSDFEKRKEMLLEFVYWLFDGFLIPLIRTNFHVTESNTHRHKLFYFRHDVWRALTEPSLKTLKANMFEHLPTEQTTRLLSMRPLGFSKIRLLPKAQGFRTIMNLKRRQQVLRNGAMSLGRSINSVMTPVFNVITHEKSLQPARFGSSLFSVTEMLPKLACFRTSLREQGLDDMPLYFAKVDVQSCFDTIPQERLLSMVDSLFSMQTYHSGKHVEISPLGPFQRLDGQHIDPPPVKRYVAHSGGAADMVSFSQLVQNKFVGAKTNTVFVNTNLQQQESKEELMRLLREHVERNVVQIGKRFYRQKTGIPQGSVLSSILCNYFYAELERDVLSFALGKECLLLRLLDDFLLITVNQEYAQRFVRVMHGGHPGYGVVVKPSKSLTNFDVMTQDGKSIAKISPQSHFPYCGIGINMTTLEVNKKSEQSNKADIGNSLTVDLSKMPGQTFHRKALNAFKIQLKAMFIDTTLNDVSTVLANLYRSFSEAAARCLEYVRVLSKVRKTCSSLLIKTVDSIIALAFVMLQRRSRWRDARQRAVVQSVISRRQIQWLACNAFQRVFQRRQTQHGALLQWLARMVAGVPMSNAAERSMLETATTG